MNEDIKWLAWYHAKDDATERVIKLGIRQHQESRLIWIYFDFDPEPDSCVVTEEDARNKIVKRWGYMDTFRWL